VHFLNLFSVGFYTSSIRQTDLAAMFHCQRHPTSASNGACMLEPAFASPKLIMRIETRHNGWCTTRVAHDFATSTQPTNQRVSSLHSTNGLF